MLYLGIHPKNYVLTEIYHAGYKISILISYKTKVYIYTCTTHIYVESENINIKWKKLYIQTSA